jgi:HEAT repeat protein
VGKRTYLVLSLCVPFFAGCGTKEKSTPQMIADIKAPKEGDRVAAVRWLGNRKDEAIRIVPALIEALKDSDSDVRRSAAIGLGGFGAQAKDAIPALTEAEHDRDARVRESAGVALSRIDPAKFVSPTQNARDKQKAK